MEVGFRENLMGGNSSSVLPRWLSRSLKAKHWSSGAHNISFIWILDEPSLDEPLCNTGPCSTRVTAVGFTLQPPCYRWENTVQHLEVLSRFSMPLYVNALVLSAFNLRCLVFFEIEPPQHEVLGLCWTSGCGFQGPFQSLHRKRHTGKTKNHPEC